MRNQQINNCATNDKNHELNGASIVNGIMSLALQRALAATEECSIIHQDTYLKSSFKILNTSLYVHCPINIQAISTLLYPRSTPNVS